MLIRVFTLFTLCILHFTFSIHAQYKDTVRRPAEREFRAAWVATVDNINWPSKPGLPVDSQKAEALRLLDFLKLEHFNAVIFQVRPQADALYQSNLEPWSYFLTGTQGKAPEPFYDPLQFWIEEAHNRGIELHVWLNPYRAHHPSGGPVTDASIVKRKPNLVLPLKEKGYWWFDPALKGTQDHAMAVVMDIVKRYDIDGVHFDDYFYPYREYNKGEDFPDSVSYTAYKKGGGTLSRNDYRRKAVNDLISRLYTAIKKEKRHVKFGLSPFGIWRPNNPEGICCFDQYDILYADAKLWLNKGWVDYFSPQLYWPTTRMNTSFPVLLGWWNEQNTMGRHLWPGINVGADTGYKSVNETLSQILITRGIVPKSKGVIHWSISSDTRNPALQKAMLETVYKKEALVPASSWLDNVAPAAPKAMIASKDTAATISWTHAALKDVFRWVVYYQYGDKWDYTIVNRGERTVVLPLTIAINKTSAALNKVMITAVDRTGNESKPVELNIIK